MTIRASLRSLLIVAFAALSWPALAVGETGPTTILGGPGGVAFQLQCQPGDFLVGIESDAMKDLNSIVPMCQHFEGNTATGNPYSIGKRGVDAEYAGGFSVGSTPMCPANTVVEGISVNTSHVNLVHSFRFNCRNPLDHNYVSSKWSNTAGGEAARTESADCGGGALAVGLIGRSGDLIDALGLLCQVLAPLPAPPDTSPPVGKIKGVMIESKDSPGMFMRHKDFKLGLSKLSTPLDYQDANFTSGPALTRQGRTAVSLESVNFPGFYIRHKGSSLVLEQNDGSQQFAQDASFTLIKRTGVGTVFESVNTPGSFIRRQGFRLFLGPGNAAAFSIAAPTSPKVNPPINVDNGDNGDDQAPPDNGGGQASAATDTTIYDQPQGNDVAYLSAGDPVTIVSCNGNNWCQISRPRKGWVWGDDLNH